MVFVISTAAPAPALTVTWSFPVGILVAVAHPGQNPPGANDWSCVPSAAHPRPVVLVHGTFANMTDSWNALSPSLKNHGYCVFSFNYGGSSGNFFQGYGAIETSAGQLATFVTKVRSATHAAKVDIVGHSQGGMMPRYYIKYLGGASQVGTLVGLAPSNHGTTLGGLASLLALFPGADSFAMSLCAACAEQVAGSAFLTKLNSGGITPGPHYVVIETKYDTIVTPYTSAFLSGATNITLQSHCFWDWVDHAAIGYDSIAARYVLNALDPAHAVTPGCHLVLPGIGG